MAWTWAGLRRSGRYDAFWEFGLSEGGHGRRRLAIQALAAWSATSAAAMTSKGQVVAEARASRQVLKQVKLLSP